MTQRRKTTAYLIEGYAGWYVIETFNKRMARTHGISEFGSGHVKDVRRATEKDVLDYCRQKDIDPNKLEVYR